MAKEKEQAQEQEHQAATGTAAPESPFILRAKSREDLDQQFQDLKAKYDSNTLTAGAVARSKDDGTYILRVDII
jgi:hypothetical protein